MKQDGVPGFLRKDHHFIGTSKLHPTQFLAVGFLVVIAITTCLLSLPISSKSGEPTKLLDALFTATSAVCVTGLSVVNTLTHWSLFGKIVIICAIQIGGLGFMSLVSMLFIVLGKRITFKNRLIMQEALNFNTTAGVVRFSKMVVVGTFVVEGIGAFFLAFAFVPEYGWAKGIWYSIFHAISAFCNAGFDLIGSDSLIPYVGNTLVNMVIMLLIILSGLGFTVWLDTYKTLKYKLSAPEHYTWKQAISKLSLHTKLVYVITGVLLVSGAVIIFIMEYHNPDTLGTLTFKEKILAAMFQSVSPRTAGFATIPPAQMTTTSKLLTLILMFIGGSPAGTAGGIKTVTVGILVICAIATIKGEEKTVIFKRRISFRAISRALTIVMIGVTVITVVIGILSTTESFDFMDIVFEAVSAFATVGTTLGITPYLSTVGKCVIIVVMFIGRLGPITIAVALMVRQNKKDKNKGKIEYPEEKIMVG